MSWKPMRPSNDFVQMVGLLDRRNDVSKEAEVTMAISPDPYGR